MQKELTRDEFRDWLDHPVTHVVFMQINERIARLNQLLEASAGLNPIEDRFLAGNIRAYRNIIELDWEEINE